MGNCTSGLSEDILQLTKEQAASLKQQQPPLKRSQSAGSSFSSNAATTTTAITEPLPPPMQRKNTLLRKKDAVLSWVEKKRLKKEKEDATDRAATTKEKAPQKRGEQDEVKVRRKLASTSPIDGWKTEIDVQYRKSLIEQVRPNEYGRQGLTPLHRACEMGNVANVKFLLALGARPNLCTHPALGQTPPIVFAASNGHSEVIRLLVAAGAEVDSADDWHNTALFKASCYNHVDCVRTLLQAGANPNVQNRWGALPVQYAALQGHSAVVKLLLDSGAELSLDGEKNVPPPLTGAAMRGYPKCVDAILKHQPNLELSYVDYHQTALYLSLQHFLLNCDEYFCSVMSNSGSHARFQCVYLLLSAGAHVSLRSLDLMHCGEMTPYLVSDEYILLMKLLLRAFRYAPEEDRESVHWLFEHVTYLGPHKWSLLRLVCSIGYTPTRDQLSGMSYALMDAQYDALDALVSNPRPLADQCRRCVRENVRRGNVLCATEQLPLPQMLKDFVSVKQANYYVV